MADNYLEKHYEEWLKRKAEWEKKGKPKPSKKKIGKNVQ
ncbi:MAG: dehydrogenase [bacterium]|nr:dehydrogenase [Candidatus Minthenecus merdequi]